MKKLLIGLLILGSLCSYAIDNPMIEKNNKNVTVLVQGGGIQTDKVIKHSEYFSTPIRVNCKRLSCDHRSDLRCQSQLQEQQPSHTYTISLLPGQAVKINDELYVCSREIN